MRRELDLSSVQSFAGRWCFKTLKFYSLLPKLEFTSTEILT